MRARPRARIEPIPGTRLSRRLAIAVGDRTLGLTMWPGLHGILRRLPRLPFVLLAARLRPPSGPWPEPDTVPDPRLRRVPGIHRDPDAEERAFLQQPLRDWIEEHYHLTVSVTRRLWREVWPIYPAYLRAKHEAETVAQTAPAKRGRDARLDPAALTKLVKEEAARLGINAIGIAPYDPKYTFAEYEGQVAQRSVIVCVVEQDWTATQSIPGPRGERAAYVCYTALLERTAKLARLLITLGHRAEAHSIEGMAVSIHYAVQAGLGQLGLNGQLLTPQAGSRARPALITTAAELLYDAPVDYGIEAICDSCKVCVSRCPPGALPAKRREYRGVVKIKLKTERCLPVVAQANGCAICMKVCPIQRYGLAAVKAEFLETGTILGKGSDELEGYRWPVDGRYYGSGEKPHITDRLLNPPGWNMNVQGAERT